jgi:MFS family permease
MTDEADRVGWAVLLAASSGALLCFLNLSALNVALPSVVRSLHASPTQASWILLSYMLVSTVCILSFGRLADLWGRRQLFLAGLALFVLACAACAVAPGAEVMLASRVCQGIGCVIYALSMVGTHGWKSTPVLAFMLAGLCAMFLFAEAQKRRASPLVDPALFNDPGRRAAYAGILLLSMTQAGPLLLVALYLQSCAGMEPSEAGLRIAPVAFGMLMAAPVAGILIRHFRPEPICLGGMLLAGSGLALLAALLQPAIGAMQLAMCLWLLGLGIGSFVTPNNASILQSVFPQRRGIANGVRSTLQNTGIMVGTALTLSVAMAQLPPGSQRMIMGNGGPGLSTLDVTTFTQGARLALAMLAVLCLAGAAILANQARPWCAATRQSTNI